MLSRMVNPRSLHVYSIYHTYSYLYVNIEKYRHLIYKNSLYCITKIHTTFLINSEEVSQRRHPSCLKAFFAEYQSFQIFFLQQKATTFVYVKLQPYACN